jgi:hypothetical protein
VISDNEVEQLVKFLWSVLEYLDQVMLHLARLAPEEERLHPLMREAWQNVRPKFAEISTYLREAKVREDVGKELADRGLAGPQLRVKLELYDQRLSQFTEALADATKSGDRPKDAEGAVRAIVHRLFGATNIVLDSLRFVPGIDPVKEFQGILEQTIPESD